MNKTNKNPNLPGKVENFLKRASRGTLTHRNLIDKLQEELVDLGLPNRTLKKIIKTILSVYMDSIVQNGKVEVRGFGIFKTTFVKGRIVIHPTTKEELIASPHYRVRFMPSPSLKKVLKEKAKNEAAQK